MKKILLAVAIVLTVSFSANAQRGGKDTFFMDWEDVSNGLDRDPDPTAGPYFPGFPQHGETTNQSAPLGSGLLILTALGAGYTLSKKNKE